MMECENVKAAIIGEIVVDLQALGIGGLYRAADVVLGMRIQKETKEQEQEKPSNKTA